MNDKFMIESGVTRRRFLHLASMAGTAFCLSPLQIMAQSSDEGSKQKPERMKTRTIPSSKKKLPVVGVGTWQQFDVTRRNRYKSLFQVLKNLFKLGGSVIDTSPMYGRAETVVGQLLSSMKKKERKKAFLATKVWTRGKDAGIRQMKSSFHKMKTSTVDLMQVHNLVDWKTHLPVLKKLKKKGKIRYIGITHYTRSAFGELAKIMKNEEIDFVQLPYSIGYRSAENRLLPLAKKKGIAVVVNRPFEGGSLFRSVRNKELPGWAKEIGCKTWAQYFLKFILGHSAVTCVIPGTSDPSHMLENARAGTGSFPDKKTRKKMVNYWKS